MAGNNFNPKKFNKIFQDNRLYNPNDEGYNNWMKEEDYDALKTPKILEGQYNKQSFNETFQNHKKKTSKALVKHSQPQGSQVMMKIVRKVKEILVIILEELRRGKEV